MSFSGVLKNTSENLEIYTELNYLWVRTGFPLAFAVTVANSIALSVFLKKTFLVKKSSYLLVNLTIADLLVGISGIVHGALLIFCSEPDILTLSGVTEMCSIASIFSLALISLERLVAVFWPFHHRIAKSAHYFLVIAVVWFLTVCQTMPIIVMQQHFLQSFDSKQFFPYLRWITLLPAASLATIVFSYLSIWVKLKFFTKFRHCRTIQENSKLTKTLFIVTVVSLATWLPKNIADSIYIINIHETLFIYKDAGLFVALFFLLLMNSLLNIIVYSFRMPEFRKELKDMFCKCSSW
ncbi:melatonin receptor type 1B-like [Actinia tenebrosa]|uniref:Melatonin receptor type 1B-like n=1 Tax=Actinia tenebrosa TaxID=6105 RepID=A0A6P8HHU4_ACTTE|nr:melatonin receptor type 1B-like [Actinia tenebrosa]